MAESRSTSPVPANMQGRAYTAPARFVNTLGTAQTDTPDGEITYRQMGPGDPKEIEAFGRKFKAGESVEVPGQFIDKAKGNPYFEVSGEKSFGDNKIVEGKAEPVQEEASFEDNLIRERSQEYLEGRTHFASPPGEADRVARAQEYASELKASREDDDMDPEKRKPGRPKSK